MHQITCSIVLYHNKIADLTKTIESVLRAKLNIKLYLIDNSINDNLKVLANNKSVEYILNHANLGYGKAHNIALKKAIESAPYHLILNPDIEFQEGTLENIYSFMQKKLSIGQLMPKVFYPNGELQKLCHLLPTPADLIGRRFFFNLKFAQQQNDKYELNGFDYNFCANIPNLSGCFMFLRTGTLKRTGLFDERYFMYMEDIDLTRRIHEINETVFYPYVEIIHGFEKESYNNKAILRHHIRSAIKYFNKWGWIFDKRRDEFNNRLLNLLSSNQYSDN